MKYVYPAIFTKESNGLYSIDFPDLESCYTCGDNLQDGIIMAEDILAFTPYDYERKNKPIPTPSEKFDISENEFINYIVCDTIEYQKKNNNKSVKKTLSISCWFNEEAKRHNINFSKTLQEALKNQLGL